MAMPDVIDQAWRVFLDYTQSYKLLTSLLLIMVFLGCKRIIIRLLRRQSKKSGDDRRHSINIIDQLGNAILLVLLLMLWSTEVQSLALSIAAFMVAIVFATREMIRNASPGRGRRHALGSAKKNIPRIRVGKVQGPKYRTLAFISVPSERIPSAELGERVVGIASLRCTPYEYL